MRMCTANDHHRRAITALACVLWIAGAAFADDQPPRPNIILMMADDLGYGDTGFNGNTIIKTPHLDEMARQSLVMRRFYAAAPVCSPTRGSSMTGRHPFRYGIYTANAGHMKPPELTLAELLTEQGYATGHFGKWHLGTLTTEIDDANRGEPGDATHFSPPWKNGFARCFSTESKVPTFDPMLKPKTGAAHKGWPTITDDADAVEYGTHYFDETGKVVNDNLRGDDSRIIMDRAVPFIEESVRARKPFFAVIWFHAPHLPCVADAQHAGMYAEHDLDARNYFGCITALDEQVGRLRATLRTLDVADNTLVFFCSDNGPEGNANDAGSTAGLRGRKRSLYEGGVRVPAIIEWPARIKQPRVSDYPAVTSDYLPTILDILGVEYPIQGRPVDGVSILPMIDGRQTERPRPICFRSGNQLAVSDNHHKLISTDGGKSWQLYDLINDRNETTDIAADLPIKVARMRATLDAWVASCELSDKGGDYD